MPECPYSALLKHDQAELNKTDKQCLEVINKDNDIIRKELKKEWKKVFLKSQDTWKKMIESDKKAIGYYRFNSEPSNY
jgi:hypothetical protein